MPPIALTDGPGLSVAAVARRLGVAPATLRTWDRRYGLGPTERLVGAHRRYSAIDLARLEYVRRLINVGVLLCDAAREALTIDLDPLSVEVRAPVVQRTPIAQRTPITSRPPVALRTWPEQKREPAPAPATPGGGGEVTRLPSGTSTARGLARASNALDSSGCLAIIDESIEHRGVIWTWETLIAPLLQGLGERWETSGCGIEVEHVLTEVATSALRGVTGRLRTPINVRPVLLAAAADELHALPLSALAGALAERHIEVRMLGQRVPPATLVQAARRSGPMAVFVWSQIHETGDAMPLALLMAIRPSPAVIIGGPGWLGPTPPGVERVNDLTEAVSRIAGIVGE